MRNSSFGRIAAVLFWLAIASNSHAQANLDQVLPIRGLAIAAPSTKQVDAFVNFINKELAPRQVNTLVLRIDYNYQYDSHPELRNRQALSKEDVKKLVNACRTHRIRIIPQINLLGHQSWAGTLLSLLRHYPEFDETPWIKMPEKYAWPNPDRLYCKSYCPLHPKVHEVVFALVDEICDVFETDAFHAGMDEVFYIAEAKCPRCGGKDPAELFAGEVKRIRDHLAEKGRTLWIWGDRLLDGKTTGLGEWEASINGTERAVDLIPKDVVICDWHYDRPDPTAVYFALKGLKVVACPWRNPKNGVQQAQDMIRFRKHATSIMKDRFAGVVQTVWSGTGEFLNELEAVTRGTPAQKNQNNAASCFVRVYEEIIRYQGNPDASPTAGVAKKKNLLVIGQSKGYQHEGISSAMAMFYDLGRQTGLWNTQLRTDCGAVTKKPLQWEAKNLNAFDAVVFYTDGELDMDPSQKADLLSFIRDDGKGFIGIHSAAITFTSWPEYIEMLGGQFDGHPWGEFDAPLVVEDNAFPGLDFLPQTFTLHDEIYQIKDYSREKVRVLARLDAGRINLAQSGVHRTDKDFAVVWARHYGKGRVLYNGLGHGQAVWERSDIRKMWIEMTQWAMGGLLGDATPRPIPTQP